MKGKTSVLPERELVGTRWSGRSELRNVLLFVPGSFKVRMLIVLQAVGRRLFVFVVEEGIVESKGAVDGGSGSEFGRSFGRER